MEDIQEFELGISQPRLDHRDTWRISRKDLVCWARATLPPVLEKINAGTEFQAGEWCQFCRFRRDCAVRANVGLTVAFGNLDATEPVNPIMDPAEKARILPKLAVIKSWLADFEKGAIADIVAGKQIGGWGLVEGRSNRKWSDPDAVARRIAPEDAFEKKLRSPAQLEKLIGKPKFSKVLGELVVKPPGRPVLVGPDDPRPRVTGQALVNFENLDAPTEE